tara:strand:+ start:30204 stop:31016 length:813 start_codon:yes stop_codon:yes gene_type:complete
MQSQQIKKPFLQSVLIVISFFLVWFLLNQISWMKLFEIKKNEIRTEDKLGKLYWKSIKSSEIEVSNKIILNSVDSIIEKICETNGLNKDKFKVHILHNSQINAFALPGGHIIIYTGLITHNDNQDAVTGVICHELAHIELNHVMKKLVKEIGLSALLSAASGSGGEVIKKGSKILSSLAFDRSLEKEADLKAIEYLRNASINPEPLANFLYLLAGEERGLLESLSWISTHPVSKERAEYIIAEINNAEEYTSAISNSTWQALKMEIQELD